MSIRDVWVGANGVVRAARRIINAGLKPLGLSSAEGNVLLHMLLNGGEVGQEQLVEQLDVDKGAISRATDSLLNKGYITKRRSEEDRRAHRLSLTPKALGIGPAVEAVYNEVYIRATKGVSAEEFGLAIGLLRRVARNFDTE